MALLLESGLSGLRLRIEFLVNQSHGQIGPLCLDERSDCIQEQRAVTALYDSPASTTLRIMLIALVDVYFMHKGVKEKNLATICYPFYLAKLSWPIIKYIWRFPSFMSFVVENLLSYNAPNNSLLGMLQEKGGPVFVEFGVEKKLYSSIQQGKTVSITILKDNMEDNIEDCSISPLFVTEIRVVGVMEKQDQGSEYAHLCREIFYIEELLGDLPIYEVLLIRAHRHCEKDGRKRRKYRELVLREHTSNCTERGWGWPARFTGYGPAMPR